MNECRAVPCLTHTSLRKQPCTSSHLSTADCGYSRLLLTAARAHIRLKPLMQAKCEDEASLMQPACKPLCKPDSTRMPATCKPSASLLQARLQALVEASCKLAHASLMQGARALRRPPHTPPCWPSRGCRRLHTRARIPPAGHCQARKRKPRCRPRPAPRAWRTGRSR